MNARLVVVEDDPLIAQGVGKRLKGKLAASVTVHAALAAAADDLATADLVVLDLQLPDSDGTDTVRRVRSLAPDLLVLVITARGAVQDRVEGLRLGADDYMVKPFSLLELEARVEALLRRRNPSQHTASDLQWDALGRRVSRKGSEIPLTPLEYEVFTRLASRPGQALSRAELLRDVIGPNFYGYERVIDVHVGHLRKKLDDDDSFRYIGTVRHYGYRWDAPVPMELGKNAP